MGKKMTPYARKRLGNPNAGTYNGAEFLNTLQRCRPYTDEPIPGSWVEGTQGAADKARNSVNAALGALARGAWDAEDDEQFDLLAHAVGVTVIRCIEIGGEKDNAALIQAHKGTEALRSIKERRVRTGKWGATRPEQIAMSESLEVYEAILQASSPAQMSGATEKRMRILDAMRAMQ
jgi:hypothetical protein